MKEEVLLKVPSDFISQKVFLLLIVPFGSTCFLITVLLPTVLRFSNLTSSCFYLVSYHFFISTVLKLFKCLFQLRFNFPT